MNACDIKISDISVSRHHALLKFVQNEFYIDDNNSKFGTLVEVNEPFQLAPDEPCCLQIGRTVIKLLVRRPQTIGASRGEECEKAGRETTEERHEEGTDSRRHTQAENGQQRPKGEVEKPGVAV